MTIRRLKRVTFFKLLEGLGEDAWEHRLATGEICVSAAFWDSLGYSPDMLPLSLKSARSILHPMDAKLAQAEMALHLKTQTSLELEIRVLTASGEWRFIRVRACITERNSAGVPAVVGGILNDLTDEVHRARSTSRAKQKISTLSSREREVLDCLVAGSSNKSVAFSLGLSPRTIEGYRARLMDKLGVRGAGELVQLALAGGVIRHLPSSPPSEALPIDR